MSPVQLSEGGARVEWHLFFCNRTENTFSTKKNKMFSAFNLFRAHKKTMKTAETQNLGDVKDLF